MPLLPDRIALLEREVILGIQAHNAAAMTEATTYRIYQRELRRDRKSTAFYRAAKAYHRATLLADSYRRALAALTEELGYVPKRPRTKGADDVAVANQISPLPFH